MNSDIEIEILESGKIRFTCKDKSHNDGIKEILSRCIEIDGELEDFFKMNDDISVIFGDRIYCG